MATDHNANATAALAERLGRLLATETHANDLLPVQWEALRYLSRANRFSRTASALTAYLGITKGTVSQTLKALESKGLVRKQGDPTDKRRNLLALTAKGRKRLQDDPLQRTVDAIESLAAGTRRDLGKGPTALRNARLQSQGRQAFGQCRDCRFFRRKHGDGAPHYCALLEEPLSSSDSDAICVEQNPL